MFKSLGGCDEYALREVKKLASALSRDSGEEESDQWRTKTSRVSKIRMKGNAALLSGRFPVLPDIFLKTGII